MRVWLLTLTTLLTLSAGCGGGSSNVDRLTFGTGLGGNGFALTGEADSFSLALTGGGTIYFKLESVADFDSRFVRLYTVYAGTGTPGTPYGQHDVVLPQSYGHIALSSFRVTDAGSYEVRAYLVTAGGAETHVADAPISITP